MKSHRIEKIIFIISIISIGLFIVSIPVSLILGEAFMLYDFIFRTLYLYGSGIAPIVLIIILIFRKKRGYKKPQSIEAMRTAKAELPSKIYKFCSLTDKRETELDKTKLKCLENNQIWVSDYSSLNDPFEGIFGFIDKETNDGKSEYARKCKELLIRERDMFRQASFTCDCSNVLMWGHYANGGRGYCIEYSVQSKKFLFPVQYVGKRPLFSSIFFNEDVVKSILEIRENLGEMKQVDDLIEYASHIQSIKSSAWSYEKEVRLIDIAILSAGGSDSNKGYNIDSDRYGLHISKIIIGHQCVYKDELIDIAKKLNVPVSVMEIPLYLNKYKLEEKGII